MVKWNPWFEGGEPGGNQFWEVEASPPSAGIRKELSKIRKEY